MRPTGRSSPPASTTKARNPRSTGSIRSSATPPTPRSRTTPKREQLRAPVSGALNCCRDVLLIAALVVLVALVVRAQEPLGLLLAFLDLVVELAARLLIGELRGLVETLIREIGVLVRELLGLVHEIRHGSSFPLRLPNTVGPHRRCAPSQRQPPAGETRANDSLRTGPVSGSGDSLGQW